MIKAKGTEDYICEKMTKGHHYVEVALDEMLSVRPAILPLVKPADSVEQLDTDNVMIGYKNQVAYEMYDDNGFTRNYDLDKNITTIKVPADGDVEVEARKNFKSNYRIILIKSIKIYRK